MDVDISPLPRIYITSRNYWTKEGLDDEDVRRFSREVCHPRLLEMRKSMGRTSTIDLEIEQQKCMLEHGFIFKDASKPDMKMCSKAQARKLMLESYMIFPACQAKFGKYRR